MFKLQKKVKSIAPEIFEHVKKGRISLSGADQIIKRVKDQEMIKSIARQIETADEKIETKELLKKAKMIEQENKREELEKQGCKVDDSGVITGDFRYSGHIIADSTVDLIFTDPPYSRESIYLYEYLAEFANRVLKPGGSCIVYFGQQMLPDIIRIMCRYLTFWWTLACIHSGPRRKLLGAGVYVRWKPLLWFVKGTTRKPKHLVDDLVISRFEKQLHDWQQGLPEALYYIEHLTPPGGLVVDPFCGSGTTLLAAKKLGRRYVGFEIDPQIADRAKGRLLEAG